MLSVIFALFFLKNFNISQIDPIDFWTKQSFCIEGNIKQLSNSKQISFVLGDQVFITQLINNPIARSASTVYNRKIMNKSFKFFLNEMSDVRYAVLSYHDYPDSDFFIDFKFIVEPGDSVYISSNDGTHLSFTGKNAEKYNCQYILEEIRRSLEPLKEKDSASIINYFLKSDSLALISFDILEKYRGRIPSEIYFHEKTLIIAFFEGSKSRSLLDNKVRQLSISSNLKDCRYRFEYIKDYKNPIWNKEMKKQLLLTKSAVNSATFLNFLYDQYRYDSCVALGKTFSATKYYEYISHQFTGLTREWLIFKLLTDQDLRGLDANNMYPITDGALKSGFIKHNWIKEIILRPLAYKPGSPAYNFSLVDSSRTNIHQHQFMGKVTLLDFWYIGCSACPQIKPYLDTLTKAYDKNELQIISICVEYRHGREHFENWKREILAEKYTSLTNLNLHAQAYKSRPPEIVKKYDIEAYPTIILIDKKGKLTEQPLDPRVDNGESLMRLVGKYCKED